MTTVAQQPDVDRRRAVPLFGLGQQQRSPFISTVQRINCIVEMTENGRQQAAIIGLPGLQEFMNLGDLPCRAIFSIPGTLSFYVAIGDQIIRSDINQAPISIGTLATDFGPVWIDSNGKELFINDGVVAFIYTLATGILTQVTNINYPVGARGGAYLQNRFWVYTPAGLTNAGRVYASDQQAGLNWDPLNFFTPEAVPDGIKAIIRWFNDLIVCGDNSIEWWTGTPTPLAGALGFKPITGANTEVGLEAERGFAGANQELFIMGNSNGQTGIWKIRGYSTEKISTPAIDDELQKRPAHFAAICTAYMVNGHAMFQVTLPNSAQTKAITLVYDTFTELWSYRESLGKPYYRGLLATLNSDSVFITDAFTGLIYKMVEGVYTEGTDPAIFEVTGIHLLKEGDKIGINELQIDLETGRAPIGVDPRGMIQISKDGGRVWGDERWVPLGKTGEYTRRAIRRRLGTARDIAVRFRITDPVPRKVTGAYIRLGGEE